MRKPIIAFEGLDFSGKSSVLQQLLSTDIASKIGEIYLIEEPLKSNNIRDILLSDKKILDLLCVDKASEQMLDIVRYYLFMSSRASAIDKILDLSQKYNIFSDRCFLSTMVYQKNINRPNGPVNILKENIYLYRYLAKYKKIGKINGPDIIFILDINYDTYLSRIDKRGRSNDLDAVSQSVVLRRINDYEYCINKILSVGGIEILRIDANQPLEDITHEIYSLLVQKYHIEE